MAKDVTASSTSGPDGAATSTRTESYRESDSVMLKKDAKGVYSWEIKGYGDFGASDGIETLMDRLRRVNDTMNGEFA